MADYDNTNSGALFRNERKNTEKHPDYTGSINCEGEEFWISGWIKTSRKGKKFMSLAITKKGESATEASGSAQDFDDDIPF